MTLHRTKKDSFSQFKRKENPPGCTFLPWRLLRSGLVWQHLVPTHLVGCSSLSSIIPEAAICGAPLCARHGKPQTRAPCPTQPGLRVCVCVCVCVCVMKTALPEEGAAHCRCILGPTCSSTAVWVRKGLALRDARILIIPAWGWGRALPRRSTGDVPLHPASG